MAGHAHSLLTAAVATAVIVFVLYRRIRRSIGRQPFQPRRLMFRTAILIIFCALIIGLHPTLAMFGAAIGGAVIGVVCGLYALRLTRFETTDAGRSYTPHPYIGLTIAALLIARVAYRFMSIGSIVPPDSAAPPSPPNFDAFTHVLANPVTAGIYLVMAGYYVCFYAGVLRTFRASGPQT